MNDDAIVKIKKSELERIIDKVARAYNVLDETRAVADDLADKIREAYKELEDLPVDSTDIIEEEETSDDV